MGAIYTQLSITERRRRGSATLPPLGKKEQSKIRTAAPDDGFHANVTSGCSQIMI